MQYLIHKPKDFYCNLIELNLTQYINLISLNVSFNLYVV